MGSDDVVQLVHVVLLGDGECSEIKAVYDSLEGAMRWVERMEPTYAWQSGHGGLGRGMWSIHTWPVLPPEKLEVSDGTATTD